MTSLWWWALPIVLLPVWWHRQRLRQVDATPLATARFLPPSAPRQLRAWRWADVLLLVLRCLLLATVIAWLADPVIAWRGDTVLTAPDALAWFRAREAEWKPHAHIVIAGPQAMPATMPHLRHPIELRTTRPPAGQGTRHVVIVSDHPAPWRTLFGAIDGPIRYVVDAAPSAATELIVWDRPTPPPSAMRAPLWWIVDSDAFPELKTAPLVDGIRYTDSAHGRLWTSAAWPPRDADAARALFEHWQRLHYAPVPYVAPPQVLAADPAAPLARHTGALRDQLLAALIVLFALERGLAHVRRR